MIAMLTSLIEHQAWADNAILKAARAEDDDLRRTLHHIVVTQRAFLSILLPRPFDVEQEMRDPGSLAALEPIFAEAHADLLSYARRLSAADLDRVIEMPWIKDSRPTIAQALLQVVMHSQGHRGQCALRIRQAGGTPPMTDYIIWLKEPKP